MCERSYAASARSRRCGARNPDRLCRSAVAERKRFIRERPWAIRKAFGREPDEHSDAKHVAESRLRAADLGHGRGCDPSPRRTGHSTTGATVTGTATGGTATGSTATGSSADTRANSESSRSDRGGSERNRSARHAGPYTGPYTYAAGDSNPDTRIHTGTATDTHADGNGNPSNVAATAGAHPYDPDPVTRDASGPTLQARAVPPVAQVAADGSPPSGSAAGASHGPDRSSRSSSRARGRDT